MWGVRQAQSDLLSWGSAIGAGQPLTAQGRTTGQQGLHPANLQGWPLPPSVSSWSSRSSRGLCSLIRTLVMAFGASPGNPGSSHFKILHLVTSFAIWVPFSEPEIRKCRHLWGLFSLMHSQFSECTTYPTWRKEAAYAFVITSY